MDFVKNEGAGDKSYRKAPGGCAVNVSIELCKLLKQRENGGGDGVAVYIVARVGDDSYGREITAALNKEGVDTSLLATDENSTSIVHMDIDSYGQRTCAGRCSGADVELCENDVKKIKFKRGDALCFTSGGFLSGSSRKAHKLAADKAKAAGALICFDVNIREGLWPGGSAAETLEPYIRIADVIKIKGHELRMIFGKADVAPLIAAAKDKFWAVHTDGFVEKHYKRGSLGGEVVNDIRLPERYYREVGMGDELFAQIVLKAVKGEQAALAGAENKE